MFRKSIFVVMCFAVASVGTFACFRTVVAEEEDNPNIEKIMKAMHHKRNGLIAKTENAVKEEKWDEAAKFTKDIKKFGESLGKNKPEKGTKESWEKLTKGYKEVTTAIVDNVEIKDAKGAKEAFAKLSKACDVCHEAHRD